MNDVRHAGRFTMHVGSGLLWPNPIPVGPCFHCHQQLHLTYGFMALFYYASWQVGSILGPLIIRYVERIFVAPSLELRKASFAMMLDPDAKL